MVFETEIKGILVKAEIERDSQENLYIESLFIDGLDFYKFLQYFNIEEQLCNKLLKLHEQEVITPHSKNWEKEANILARENINLHPCRNCKHPVITGCCCETCGNDKP